MFYKGRGYYSAVPDPWYSYEEIVMAAAKNAPSVEAAEALYRSIKIKVDRQRAALVASEKELIAAQEFLDFARSGQKDAFK